MRVSFRLKKLNNELEEMMHKSCTDAEKKLAKRILKDTDEFVPAVSGDLAKRAKVNVNKIIYSDPKRDRVRYLYEGKRMVDPETGKGPRHWVDKNGNDVFRWKLGTKPVATEDPLTYSKAVHPKATDHWIEASKEENWQKWLDFIEEEIMNGLK